MRRALNLLRQSPHYRRACFSEGLQAAGFQVVEALRDPRPGDVLLGWNRYGGVSEQADHFERRGAAVLVVENCPLGNDLHGGSYSVARRHVALTGGGINEGGPERWDAWSINRHPWRTGGREVVVLGQRGIGHPDVRSPEGWAEQAARKTGGRVRVHPGTGPAVPLADDLKHASAVITWSSAAALQALLLGVPVWNAHPEFIGAPACRPLAEWGAEAKRDDAARLAVFRRLAWAIWTLDEIRTGAAIAHLTTAG
jgi:hypothetical protein